MKQRASLMALALLLGITACSQSGKPASNDTTLGGALTPQVVQKNDGEAYMPIVMTFPSSTGGNNANYYGSSAVRGTDGYMYFDLAGNPQDGGTYTTTLVRVGNDRSSTFFDETCCI